MLVLGHFFSLPLLAKFRSSVSTVKRKNMSFEGLPSNLNEIYFTPQHQIEAMVRRGEIEFDSGQRESDYVNKTTEGSDVPSSNNSLVNGVYVLPPQDRTTNNNSVQPQMRPVRTKKPVVQDVYDEDHYCLARNSGFFTNEPANTNERVDVERNPKTSNKLKGWRLKTIMVIIGIILVTFSIGGIVAYLVNRRQGMKSFYQ